MNERVLCTCGAVLVEDVTDAGVKPVGGANLVRFRRTTDFVMCGSCLKSYGVRELIARVGERDVIARLERMAADQTGDD